MFSRKYICTEGLSARQVAIENSTASCQSPRRPLYSAAAVSVLWRPVALILPVWAAFAAPGNSRSGLQFYPVTPCRVADTRAWAGMTGVFGPPSMAAKGTRDFPISAGACGIPSTAAAYSLNITAAPANKPLGWLTAWPAGQPQPLVSTLNAGSGQLTANAVIVSAGTRGSISLYVSDPTDVVIDIDGYFAPPESSALVWALVLSFVSTAIFFGIRAFVYKVRSELRAEISELRDRVRGGATKA